MGWVYCLLRANHEPNKVLIGTNFINVNRGEFITSRDNFAKATSMSPQMVRTFWALLEKDEMINRQSTSTSTKISICNYGNYQDVQPASNQQTTSGQPAVNQRSTTDKNVKKEKNDKNVKKKEVVIMPFDSPEFLKWWDYWKEYKSKDHKFKYKSHLSEQAAAKKLSELAGGDEVKAVAIIEQSMAQGWAGLFELKSSESGKGNLMDQVLNDG
jgi:hypothetical protein